MLRPGLLILPLVLGAVLSAAQPLTAAEPYGENERLDFVIKKLLVTVGQASLEFRGLETLDRRQAYLIVFKAKAINFFDEEKIYVDPQSFRPVRVERNLNIWGRREKIVEEYDARGQVVITKTAAGKVTRDVINKSAPLDNIYAFIYYYRRHGQFEKGASQSINLPTQEIKITLDEFSSLKIPSGQTFVAALMESEPSKYRIWFDVGPNKIPLRIDGTVGLARTSMILTTYTPSKKRVKK